MLGADGKTAGVLEVLVAVGLGIAGILPLAAAIAGYLSGDLAPWQRLLLLATAAMTLFPGGLIEIAGWNVSLINLLGVVLFAAFCAWRAGR